MTSCRLLKPTLLVDAVWHIELDQLYAQGIRGLLLDLDNTIVLWNESSVPGKVRDWVQTAKKSGLQLCLVSNALGGRRVRQVAADLGIQAVTCAGKPFPRAFRRAMAQINTTPATTCAMGDQVFTDMLGANWLGLITILVQPLGPREAPHTRLIRLLERPLRRYWKARIKQV